MPTHPFALILAVLLAAASAPAAEDWPAITTADPPVTRILPTPVEPPLLTGVAPAWPSRALPAPPGWTAAGPAWDPVRITALAVVRAEAKRISPYTGGELPLFKRVVAIQADGTAWATPDLAAAAPPPVRWLPASALRCTVLGAPGEVDAVGVLHLEPCDPLAVVQSGWRIDIGIAGSTVRDTVTVEPEFGDPVAPLPFTGRPGLAARNGSSGQSGVAGEAGASGDPGSDGQDGEAATLFGQSGRSGEPGTNASHGSPGGSGRPGSDGGNAGDGGNGLEAPAVTVMVSPLLSPFYPKPVMQVIVKRGEQGRVLIAPWGQAVPINARGGDGSAGGAGAPGAAGGIGGPGGAGGNGGRGGRGGQGADGRRGLPGRDATANLQGGDGGGGGDGGAGGPGGNGGRAGHGGHGGNGGKPGNGGRGGDGGLGGNGAVVTVEVIGDADFVAMAKQALRIDVAGGRAGRGGTGGAPGRGAAGGPGGRAGSAGSGGDGGRGGHGGLGGPGGDPAVRVDPVTNGPVTTYVQVTVPGGLPGAPGRPGLQGAQGDAGEAASEGEPGQPSEDGRAGGPGRDGVDGQPGRIIWKDG